MAKRKIDHASDAPRVYSYIRFSRPEQALGDSERRQLEEAKAWAERNGYVLDCSLRLTDRGYSAFHGHHRRKGALGKFLDLVKSGQIAKGSIIVIENIDRLTREGMTDALKTIIYELIGNGITIQTLRPLATYDQRAVDGPEIYELIGQIRRAYEDSKRKSDLGQANWKQKRKLAIEQKQLLTRQIPRWLEVKQDGKRVAIPAAKKTIQLIFELKLEGFGTRTIEAKLNKIAQWVPPKNSKRKSEGWRASYIKKILCDRSVIGEYQPHQVQGGRGGRRVPIGEPIAEYFPPVVDPELFYAVQERLKENRGKGGRTGKARNLFVTLVKCAYCGGSMILDDKGRGPKGASYLACCNGMRRVKCDRHRVRYDECEKTLLENLHKLRPDQVLPSQGKLAQLCRDLMHRVRGRNDEIKDKEKRIETLERNRELTDDKQLVRRDANRLSELRQEKQKLELLKKQDEKELAKAERGRESFVQWKADLSELFSALKRDDVELRLRLRAHLREFIASIHVFAVGHREKACEAALLLPAAKEVAKDNGRRTVSARKASIRDEDSLDEEFLELAYEYFPEMFNDKNKTKEFYAILHDVMRRRLSKEGRFLRIHFISGTVVDVAPLGSIATSSKLTVDEKGKSKWIDISPRLGELWREFAAKQGKRQARGKRVAI